MVRRRWGGGWGGGGGVCSDVACRGAIKNHRGVYAGNGASRGDLGRGGAVGAGRKLPAHPECPP